MAAPAGTGRATGLTGPQKAALLVLQLGRERAARVMGQLEVAEIEELAAQILRLDRIEQTLADQVLDEFYAVSVAGAGVGGGTGLAQQLLEAALGAERASGVMQRLQTVLAPQPFEFLQSGDPHQVVPLLTDEHPQTVALVLAHLRPETASAILADLPAESQAEVAHRIALLQGAAPDVVAVVADALRRKADALLAPVETAAVGGVDPLVEIIHRADPGTSTAILEGLAGRDGALAEEVRSRLFVFADILLLDDRAVQLVLRQVETSLLSLALKGAADDVREKVLSNLSERARENLLEEIDVLGPVRLAQVEEARSGVVAAIRALEEAGQVTIRRGGEDDLVA